MNLMTTDHESLQRLGGISSVRELAARIQGRLLCPGAAGYDPARRVFNAMIDRHPALIIQCAGAADAAAGIGFARTHQLAISIKSGGHSVAGTAICHNGVVLDLSAMKRVRVDPARSVATAQPGLTLGDLDRATQDFGLATPTGVMSGTGMSGLALGGGLGWLNGKHGLTCDNLLAAEVVTAAGELVCASEQHNEDLLWGLRGGGGNFGVVTSFTFRLHPVDTVLAGSVTYSANKARAALRLYREFAPGCPDELSANASLFQTPDGQLAVSIGVCHAGSIARGEKLLKPLRKSGPEDISIQPSPYVDLQSAPDASFPPGQQHYWKSGYLTAINDELIDVLVESVARMPSTASGVGLQQMHGSASRVPTTAAAFPHRGERYDCLILSQWPDRTQSPQNIAWTRELFDAIQPHLAAGVYVNNLGEDDQLRVQQAYGPNHARLAELKRKYDPANLFHHNHNISPATRPAHEPLLDHGAGHAPAS